MMEVPYHYQFRIIVIGDTMVGKSSLLKTFSDGSFGDMEPTVGVDFFSKIIDIQPKHRDVNIRRDSSSHDLSQTSTNNYSHRTKRDESIIVKLQIWDTAGQERFKSIVTSYYRNSVGIILVYDVTNRESYEHLIDWFTEARRHVEPSPSPTLSPITQKPPNHSFYQQQNQEYPLTSTPNRQTGSRSNANNTGFVDQSARNIASAHSSGNSYTTQNSSQVTNSLLENSSRQQLTRERFKMAYLVLGCKTDLEDERQVSYEDGQAFADMYGFNFIETSSKTHYNVNRAFQMLAEEIYDKIVECGRSNRLHRTPSGGHLTFDGTSSQVNEGIRIGPLIESTGRHASAHVSGVRLLEAQPVSGFMGGCC